MRELSDDVYAALFGASGHKSARAELERKMRAAKRLNEEILRLERQVARG
jgi:hypothetical protein